MKQLFINQNLNWLKYEIVQVEAEFLKNLCASRNLIDLTILSCKNTL